MSLLRPGAFARRRFAAGLPVARPVVVPTHEPVILDDASARNAACVSRDRSSSELSEGCKRVARKMGDTREGLETILGRKSLESIFF